MKATVNRALNVRQSPSVNARILKYFEEGDDIKVDAPVLGDPFEGDMSWFRLKDGNFVWAGAVDITADADELSEEDRNQWLMSFRQNDRFNRPDLEKRTPAERLFFAPAYLPTDDASVVFNPDFDSDAFVGAVVDSVRQIPREHVFIYIHGFELLLLRSLKIDLFSTFVDNYFTHAQNKVAKAIFMMWPGEGTDDRKVVDDGSIIAGEIFTTQKLFNTFVSLSNALKGIGKSLNLVVHSFGHQLFNGMLTHLDTALIQNSLPVFKNIFLMAPDITHLAGQKGGVMLKNYFRDSNNRAVFTYALDKLGVLANDVHVFYDKYDFLLYVSTKKFVDRDELDSKKTKADRDQIVDDYRNLGNYGDLNKKPINNFHFIDVTVDLLKHIEPRATVKYPFSFQKRKIKGIVDDIHLNSNYEPVNGWKVFFNSAQFKTYHRYLYTCRAVVDKVMSLL